MTAGWGLLPDLPWGGAVVHPETASWRGPQGHREGWRSRKAAFPPLPGPHVAAWTTA